MSRGKYEFARTPLSMRFAPPKFCTAQRPEAIAGATWQAGVTPNNFHYRPFIDGEPVPLCFAANIREGWAMLYVARRKVGRNAALRDFDRIARDIDGKPVTQLVRGNIEVRRTRW